MSKYKEGQIWRVGNRTKEILEMDRFDIKIRSCLTCKYGDTNIKEITQKRSSFVNWASSNSAININE